MGCSCIKDFNAKLCEHNAVLVTTLFADPPRCVIATEKRDTKIRGKLPVALASFCPFCGISLARPSPPDAGEPT